jgi:hypothetical protein
MQGTGFPPASTPSDLSSEEDLVTTVIGSGLFTTDDHYDTDRASKGTSRFLAYCQLNRGLFTDYGGDDEPITTDPAMYAAAAWHCATGPVMSPPYIQHTTPLILSATMQRSQHDGSLLAAVDLVTPRPTELRSMRNVNEWEQQRGFGTCDYYTEPSDHAMTRRPTLLTSAKLYLPLPTVLLHHPADAPERLTADDVKAAVRTVAALLDEQLTPILTALTGRTGAKGGSW